MYTNSFFKKALFIFSIVFLCSCDKDYNSIGDDLIGGNHFTFEKYTGNVVAYNQKITAIQSNNQVINPLGIYDNPDFGTTTANFVTQLSLAAVSPTVINASTATVESVQLSIPYFVDATQSVANIDGTTTYVLDSIYGNANAKMKLSIFRSGYYLRTLDPIGGFINPQKYYSDQNSVFNSAKIGSRLNDNAATSQNDEFFFDKSEEATTTTVDAVTTTTYKAPAMRLKLSPSYFKTAIIDAVASGKLASNDIFTEYFRGLYFQIEKSGSNPTNLAMLNFAGGTITINYKDEKSTTDNTKIDRSIVLNLIGNTVSLLEQTDTKTGYADATNNSNIDTTLGDKRLYVKGGEGSIAVLSILGNGELETLKNKGWLVNEANLIFNVDKTLFTGTDQPQRLYLYDLNNNRPIVDYFDSSTGTTPKKGQLVYGGLLSKDAAGNSYYKFRITNHIRNLIQKDSTNIKLGLVVTEAISNSSSVKLKTATPITNITQAPQASVINPLGTILFGNNIPASDPNFDKRLKLEIYYTKPN